MLCCNTKTATKLITTSVDGVCQHCKKVHKKCYTAVFGVLRLIQNRGLVAHRKRHGSNAIRKYTEGGVEYTNKGQCRENVVCREVYFKTHFRRGLEVCSRKLKSIVFAQMCIKVVDFKTHFMI